ASRIAVGQFNQIGKDDGCLGSNAFLEAKLDGSEYFHKVGRDDGMVPKSQFT
ncbi:hypothetical protein ACJMK2_005884, partial [Sinanodonta woodiana]